MMHRLRRYDIFRFAKNDCCSFHSKWCDVCPEALAKRHHFQRKHHWRSQYHLLKANIIEKTSSNRTRSFLVPLTGIEPAHMASEATALSTELQAQICVLNGKSRFHKEPALVPVAGVEPARCCHHGILSPARLPIPSHRLHIAQILLLKYYTTRRRKCQYQK